VGGLGSALSCLTLALIPRMVVCAMERFSLALDALTAQRRRRLCLQRSPVNTARVTSNHDARPVGDDPKLLAIADGAECTFSPAASVLTVTVCGSAAASGAGPRSASTATIVVGRLKHLPMPPPN
jgi:hypothetical protein